MFLAQWSPDGSKLAVMARAPGRAWQIYLVNKDGGNPETLFKDTQNAADPAWSANGQQLAYGREPDTMGQDNGLHTIAVFDLSTRKVETLPSSKGLFSPRWSPDGRWIAALTLDQKKVMLFDVAKRSWTELATTSASDPVWSRDSKAIFVHAFMAEKQPILRIAVPGAQTQVVAGTGDFHAGEPANYFFGGLTPADLPLVTAKGWNGQSLCHGSPSLIRAAQREAERRREKRRRSACESAPIRGRLQRLLLSRRGCLLCPEVR